MTTHDPLILHGRLLDPAYPGMPLGWLGVENGRVAEVYEGAPPGKGWLGGADRLITPGFVDAHVHLPQFPAIGIDGLELLDWLSQAIYPAEMAWAEVAEAERAAGHSMRAMLRAGTIGFAGYLTSHAHAVDAVVKAAAANGMRWIAGRMLMDRECPASLQCAADAEIGPEVQLGSHARGSVSINPRFAISCSEALLQHAGGLAQENVGVMIQTHLAESKAECARIAELFPDDANYTAVYDRFGLLTQRTLLAHCLHLSADEWALIAERRSMIVHCPTANTFLGSGLFDLRTAHEHGIRVGLGSDVAAGPDVAMPRVARAMIDVAKLRRLTVDPNADVPTPAEAWRMITHGNAAILGWSDYGLKPGDAADVLVLRSPSETDHHPHGRLIYGWSDALIEHRIVDGRVVAES